MTRYARGVGSKSCNSKQKHVSTSWLSLKEQVIRKHNRLIREEKNSPRTRGASTPSSEIGGKESWFDFGMDAGNAIPQRKKRLASDYFPESKTCGQIVKLKESSGLSVPVGLSVKKDSATFKGLRGNADSNDEKCIRGKSKRVAAKCSRTQVAGRTFQVPSKECIRDIRRKEKALKREKKKVCFSCRRWGHQLADCPEFMGASSSGICSPAGGLCYHCGSTEHKADRCNKKWINSHQFARCFVCGEDGHLARECSENPKGKYPKGGSCRICGKTSHLCGECPQNVNTANEEGSILTCTSEGPVDSLPEDIGKYSQHEVGPQKIIQF